MHFCAQNEGNYRILFTCYGVIPIKEFKKRGWNVAMFLLGSTNILSETAAFLYMNEVAHKAAVLDHNKM